MHGRWPASAIGQACSEVVEGRCSSKRQAWRRATKKDQPPEQPEDIKEAEIVDDDEAIGDEESKQDAPTYKAILDKIRKQLDPNSSNAAVVESLARDLEKEVGSLEAHAQGMQEQSGKTDTALRVSKDQYLRLTADFENFRKRSAVEKDSLATKAKADVIISMLPLIDNFERASGQIKAETEQEQKIDAAYQGLYKQMVDIFRGMGMEACSGKGSIFDPNFHDAIMREQNDDVPDGTILQEFRRGFKIGDRLLRPAMVQVSYSEGPSSGGDAHAATDEGSVIEPGSGKEAPGAGDVDTSASKK
ncbi:hypothetical protein WJX74_005989 [Apatococcus lobatus]|uniref:GrpE protein homolog n=1 Tax=Apatococcus lobatus TaxID=904363 RepID=A0AAW1RC33_9CHLO